MTSKSKFLGIALCAVALSASSAFAQRMGICGQLGDGYGPFDYRIADIKEKQLVEGAHFPPWVETLQRGNRTVEVGGDIDYTLRAFPNHPRALMSMVRLAKRENRSRPAGAKYPVECYFDRAVRFTPDDPMVRVLYGDYLAKRSRPNEARQHLAVAEANGSDDAQIVYNLGLAYFELKEYEKAARFAKQAIEMGIQFPGLRQKLERAGKWPG